MARKKKIMAAPENHERWLVSYADFITLLFAFFVVMFAASYQDRAKAQQVSESIQQALEQGQLSTVLAGIMGAPASQRKPKDPSKTGTGNSEIRRREKVPDPPKDPNVVYELLPSLNVLRDQLQKEIQQGALTVTMEQRGLVVSLRQAAFFRSGEETVRPETYSIIQKVADAILKLPNKVRLEGHTDADPIHTARFHSNWELSAARGVAMLELLAGRYGVEASRMSVGGYADTVPLEANDSEEHKAVNRRVDVIILNEYGSRAEPTSALTAEEAAPKAGEKPAAPAQAAKPAPSQTAKPAPAQAAKPAPVQAAALPAANGAAKPPAAAR